MPDQPPKPPAEAGTLFEIFHELMASRVRRVLLVISPYDAFLLEQGDSLASRIEIQYRGLNLSNPPRLSRVSTGPEAIRLLAEKNFDLVIIMPQPGEPDCFAIGREIKKLHPELPVILLAHNLRDVCPGPLMPELHGVDRLFVWSTDPDFLLALIKNVEDHLNVERDTRIAMVRVVILVEDSPRYRSALLPLIYKEVVRQTQAVLDESLNPEQRLLKMRARPKILVAESFEAAMQLFHTFRPYVFCIISDTRFPRHGQLDSQAGQDLLAHIRAEVPDMPLLLLSAEPANRQAAERIPAAFLDKNGPELLPGIRDFFLSYLGFGDFVFRLPDGREVDRAENLAALEQKLAVVPDESLIYHARRNHFSNWVMARSEVALAYQLREEQVGAKTPAEVRTEIITALRQARRLSQQGLVSQFSTGSFDAGLMDFVKIGQGAMGGKALGLAFMANRLLHSPALHKKHPQITIHIPMTLVITTDGFSTFVTANRLHERLNDPQDDEAIARTCQAAELPDWLIADLAAYLAQARVPLAVRSSSILEDVRLSPYAGLYKTCLLPNNDPDPGRRLAQLAAAVKLVYASVFFAGPRAFARATDQTGADSMAVIIQHLAGRRFGDYFYPAISGYTQSHNFYPLPPMQAADGIAHIALGLGKAVAAGERVLRFSPAHPSVLPQFSTVDDMLANSQRYFYVLQVKGYPGDLHLRPDAALARLEMSAAGHDYPVQMLTSTYFPEEHRIRDIQAAGPKVLTFAQVLKHKSPPLAPLLAEFLTMGREGMGCDVEIEFALDLAAGEESAKFYFLQIRPMATGRPSAGVAISEEELAQSFCSSSRVLGHGESETVRDIVQVKPGELTAAIARQLAREIGQANSGLVKEKRPYLLIGPGRWGSADPWLGIPVQWQEISGVAAIIELLGRGPKAEPSGGTHFFQNITALGIPYFTVNLAPSGAGADFLDLKWLASLPALHESRLLRQMRLEAPIRIKVDGRTGRGVMQAAEQELPVQSSRLGIP